MSKEATEKSILDWSDDELPSGGQVVLTPAIVSAEDDCDKKDVLSGKDSATKDSVEDIAAAYDFTETYELETVAAEAVDKDAVENACSAAWSGPQEKLSPFLELPNMLAGSLDKDACVEKDGEIVVVVRELETDFVKVEDNVSAKKTLHARLGTTSFKRNVTSQQRMRRRMFNRREASLPMFACKDEFTDRLRAEKVLVVTAETGSGKTTQLPQYCAEEFPGMVICTQPRAIAAISVAQRIAKEFDDAKVGGNVGYEARGGNRKRGRQIMITTDAALIRMAQRDRLLKMVGVLIIDEAHERSLNTDIVIGIAKTILRQRPNDFRVVIASATIDPKPFLEFFFDEHGDSALPPPLTVPGRVFPVTTETKAFGKSNDFSSALAKVVVKALQKRTLGHCLVFLQGSREVDAAIECFRGLAPKSWVAMPLYGTLSPEEQSKVLTFDDKQGAQRMVVFCTNVAETSLTVPNVRIVIDTGLAKESRYDAQCRMTILEEVYISRSSADQRKGRAGRTAEGHCLRLFAWDTLTRQNIEPEILRSSLDLVMLQVCSLGFNPLEFDFISRPDEASMRSSLAMLLEMDCLTPTFSLTERGKLFNNLPFDPRLSNFVLMAHEDFKQGSAAAVIAAIVSAPGSILFFDKSKDNHPKPDSDGFSSDLLMLRSIYETWMKAGEVDGDGNTCGSCRKDIKSHVLTSDGGCRSCRTKYSKAMSLNNKVLDFVRGTVAQVHKEIQSLNVSSSDETTHSIHDTEQAIGVCLAVSFPEQVCELIAPTNPTLGVYAIASDLKGQLSYSSVLRVARTGAKYIIAMSQTRLPSGLVLMDKAHYIDPVRLPPDARRRVQELSLNIVECYKKINVSGRYCSFLRKHFQSALDDGVSYARFVVCQYDVTSNAISVLAPRVNGVAVAARCDTLVRNATDKDLSEEVVVDAFNGFAKLTVTAGFSVKNIEAVVEEPCRVHFVNPPVKSRQELLDWACRISGCKASDIKWHSYLSACEDDGQNSSSAIGIVVFRRVDFAEKAQRYDVSAEVISEHGNYRALVKTCDDNLDRLLDSLYVIRSKTKKIKSLICQILILNLPDQIDDNRLKVMLKNNGLPNPSLPPKISNPGNRGRQAIVTFNVDKTSDEILTKCQAIPELGSRCHGKFRPAQHIIFFQKCEQADALYRKAQGTSELEVDGSAVLLVPHPEVFRLQELLDSIGCAHGVKSKLGRKFDKGKSVGQQEVIFFGNRTSKCDGAAQALKKLVEPIQYFFGSRDRELMGAELYASGVLQVWADQYSLFVEERFNRGNFSGMYIYGDKYQQGQFMADLADYYNGFASRYRLLGMSPNANCLFRKGNPGEAELEKLIKKTRPDEVQISYQSFLSSIEIVVKPNTLRKASVIIEECVSAIDAVLRKFNQNSSMVKNCVYCNEHPGRHFYICGHPYCKECLQQIVSMHLSSFKINKYLTMAEALDKEEELRMSMGSCPLCKTLISVRDLRFALSRSSMVKACMGFAQLLMRREDHPMGVCPMPECEAFVPKQLGYSPCPYCKQSVCPSCGAANDSRHAGNTCEQYQVLLKQGIDSALLRSIVSDAKSYVSTHWQSKSVMKSLVRIEDNPGIERGCMALQRYCGGILRVGLNELEKNSVFAWHGTTSNAIPAICDDGFDPQKRSGQLHGPGEYFGIDADTSLGYSKGCERLIVVQIIKCHAVKEVPNFCYVVNNPTDWSYSFCLPLLVVTCGSPCQPSIDWILQERRPLPFPFKDEPDPEEALRGAIAESVGVHGDRYIRVKPTPPVTKLMHYPTYVPPPTAVPPSYPSTHYPNRGRHVYPAVSAQTPSTRSPAKAETESKCIIL